MPIDLLGEYGYAEVILHAAFPTAEVAGKFICDFAVNTNKSVRIAKNNGDYRRWTCTAADCNWFISLSRRGVKLQTKSNLKRPASKLSHLPDNSWYISKFNLQHAQCCCSTANPTGRQVATMSGFQAGIVEGHSTSRARVVNNLKGVENIDVSQKSAVLYRQISGALARMESDDNTEFKALPAYTELFAQKNIGSRVCCQLDTNGRFFRAFLSIGSVVKVQHSLIPVWECDGTHMKHPKYNGVCLTLVGKDGNKRVVPVAIAYVHKETVDNFVWFFLNCIAGGISLRDRPTFTYRGKQLSAQCELMSLGLQVHIKLCAVHIRFNTVDKFKSVGVKKDSVNAHIMQLQSSRTMHEYERNIVQLQDSFPTAIVSVVDGKRKEETVASYLRKIHPTNWTVVGNCELCSDEAEWITDNWIDVACYGSRLPLFGVRTTSGAEGDNNGLLWTRARNNLVFRSLQAYCLRAVRTRNALLKEARKWVAEKFDITPHAMNLFTEEKKYVAKLNVVFSRASCFYVYDPFDRTDLASTTTMFETDMSSGKCRPCRVAEQLQIPCRHIQAVLYALERQNPGKLPLYKTLQYFHPAYLVSTVHAAFAAVEINLPVETMSITKRNILPAPLYRQAGGARKARAADIQRGEKRIHSRGEEIRPSQVQLNRSLSISPLTAETDEFDDTSGINAFFQSQLTAESTAVRGEYHCRRCGYSCHNATTCSVTGQEIEEAGVPIQPGEYVLGSAPQPTRDEVAAEDVGARRDGIEL